MLRAMAETGRLAYMPEPGRVEIREYPLPEPEPGALLLKTLIAGVCGSEIHIFRGGHPLLQKAVLGHEIVGEIAALGAGVTADSTGVPLAAGDRVTATYFRTCLHCPACGRGDLVLCHHGYAGWMQPPEAFPHFVGTHGTHYYVHPTQWVYRVPDAVSSRAVATANCGLAQVVCGVDRAELRAGETLLVQGAGGLGLYAAAVAKEHGARVVVVDPVATRLAQALRFGADEVVDMSELPDAAERRARILELTGPEGADAAIDVAGVPAAFSEGVGLVRPGGRYVEIGTITPGKEATLDLGALTRRAVRIIPVIRYEPWYLADALRFLERARERFPFEEILDALYPLEEIERALDDSAERKVTRAGIAPT